MSLVDMEREGGRSGARANVVDHALLVAPSFGDPKAMNGGENVEADAVELGLGGVLLGREERGRDGEGCPSPG